MDDRLDEELKNRIKKVFDEYQDPSADEGWAELRKKFPGQADKRRGLIWLWLGAAAVVLLALSIGIWKYSDNNSQQNLAVVKNHSTAPQKSNPPAVKPAETQPQLASAGSNTTATTSPANQPHQVKNTAREKVPSPAGSNNLAAVNGSNHINNTKRSTQSTQQNTTIPTGLNIIPRSDSGRIAVVVPSINKPSVTKPTTTPASQPTATQPDNKPKSVTDMIAKNNPKPDKIDIKASRVHLGVYAASFVNYAKGSANQSNVGAGFTAEIQIVKHLKLVTGVSLAANSLNYTGAVPSGAAQTGFFSPSSFPSYTSPGANTLLKAASAENVASIPAFKNYGVSMFNIDVPVNLKFDFNIRRNNFYLMTGLSSGTFANETYTYYYNYPALPSPALQAPHAETSKNYFSNFYVGKMLNLAVGYGYPIGRNHIIIEPFVKYPLGGMGTQDIRFGAGGINLKLNFPTK